MRTWVYRVAHNVATSHVIRHRRAGARALISLEEIESIPDPKNREAEVDRKRTIERLHTLIQQLKPLDRQLMVLYLEGLDARAIGEITGISPGNAATKIHRIKKVLTARFQERRTA